jgi:hypothetical protein
MTAFTLRPATGDVFVGRSNLIEEMVDELGDPSSTSGYALYGKRRIGKTSVLFEVRRRLMERDDIIPVYFSVWNLVENTVSEFCRMLSGAVIDAYRPYSGITLHASDLLRLPLHVLADLLGRADFRLIYHDIEVLLSFSRDEDITRILDSTFTLAERLAEKTGTKCVLMVDEFPSILDLKHDNARIGEQLVKLLRTRQETWTRTSLSVSGSIRSTMDLTVLSAGSPFYRQFIVREVMPLQRICVRDLLVRHLDISDMAIEEIHRFTGGIPFYIQYLGKILLRKGSAGYDEVKAAEDNFLREEGNLLFNAEFCSLGPKERLVALGLARGECSPRELAVSCGDRVSNINRFLMYLVKKGFVRRIDRGVYGLEDPVFARWLALHASNHFRSA